MNLHPTPPKTVASREGFTLIELLVVISIIAILVSVTIPIYKMVSDASNSAKSLTNLRNIGTVLKTYSSENDNKLPAVESEEELDWTDLSVDLQEDELSKLPYWVRALIHHSAESDADISRKVFSCSGLRWKDAENKKIDTKDILLAYGCTEAMFGFDEDGERLPTEPRSIATIENAPNTIMVVETKQDGSELTSYPDVTWLIAKGDFEARNPSDSNRVDFRFKKNVNCLMADGSVRSIGKKEKRDVQEPHWTGEDYESIR